MDWADLVSFQLLDGVLVDGRVARGNRASLIRSPRAEPKSDHRSLRRLFGAELSNNALEIRSRSRKMPPDERYDYLLQKVLPRETNQICIAIDFLATNPSPPVLKKYGSVALPLLKSERNRRIPSGGALVSPAIDLVELAGQLGKRDELKANAERRLPTEPEQIKARFAILILIAAAEGDAKNFGILVNEFLKLVRKSPVTDLERAPEMVVVWQGMQAAETSTELFDLLTYLRLQVLFGDVPHPARIKRHIVSLQHILDEQLARQNAEPTDHTAERPLERWHIASQDTAVSRGNGYPNAMWTTAPGRVRHISNHDFDYLYYSIPLRGDFEIEGELNTFGYRGTRLVLGTTWAGPVYGRKTVQRGTLRGLKPPLKVDPPFSRFSEWMHVREVVQNSRRTTAINGRDVLERLQSSRDDPWLAAMSSWKNCGEVRNLRITGNPEIPNEIDLIADSDLPGWLPYFGESVGARGRTWSLQEPQPGPFLLRWNSFRDKLLTVLTGQKHSWLAGQFRESLLRYHRPVVEDGTIEYEFYYKRNEVGVCPALDRCCFLFDSQRAGIHWLTDGKFDRTGLDPANFTPLTNKQIPLQENAWNRVQLTLEGDEARVVLNEKTILARTLEPENLRTFGLFHYSDQTTVEVRNLHWRGKWPKELPPPRKQELADFTLEDELAQGPELQTVFEQDFSKGLPVNQILVAGRNWQELTEERPNGLWMKRPGGSYDLYEKNSLSLPFGLKGDFDITWEFEDFQSKIVENGNGNVHVFLWFADDNSTECRLYRLFRKRGFPDKGDHEELVDTAVFHTPPNGKKRFSHPARVAEHSPGGKLRFVRRGPRCFSFLPRRIPRISGSSIRQTSRLPRSGWAALKASSRLISKAKPAHCGNASL